MGRSITGGTSDSMCFRIFLRSSTGSMSGDNTFVVAAPIVCMATCLIYERESNLLCCVRASVILKSLSKSSFDLYRTSINSFNFCLFTWAAYLVTFWMEMTWTRVSCCLHCASISWFTHCLIFNVFLMVAVHVSHYNVSSRKGNMLLFDHGFSELILSNHTANLMAGL